MLSMAVSCNDQNILIEWYKLSKGKKKENGKQEIEMRSKRKTIHACIIMSKTSNYLQQTDL